MTKKLPIFKGFGISNKLLQIATFVNTYKTKKGEDFTAEKLVLQRSYKDTRTGELVTQRMDIPLQDALEIAGLLHTAVLDHHMRSNGLSTRDVNEIAQDEDLNNIPL